ncbi:MAG TPA: efflux transporter periplasmic adaptor subunit, partial [Rhodocyclaceae bacterium]
LVPEEALVPFGSDQFVFRVDAQGESSKVARVRVETGVRRDGAVEIRSGLAAGDRVVVAGQLKIRDGAAVKPIPSSGANTAAADGGASPAPRAPAAEPGKG